MACFLVPAAEAVVTTVIQKSVYRNEDMKSAEKHPFISRLNWLNNMLWGGSALLAFEHLWHGEITPWFPVLTAAANPSDFSEMLREMAVSGVGMAVLVTVVWAALAAGASRIGKKSAAMGENGS